MSTKRHTVQKAEAATVEWWPAERVIPYARNPRTATDTAVGKVAASIKEFGFRVPIIVDSEGVIIAGHTRLAAAKRLGLERVPVLVAADLSPAQVKAYRLADNRTAQESTWDLELLGIELEDLAGLDVDLSLTGFDAEELLDLGGERGDGEPRATLNDRFGVPPFSVLDARQGYWQERKRAWLALGIRSELGRGGGNVPNGTHDRPAASDGAWERGYGKKPHLAPGGAPMPLDRAKSKRSAHA